MSEVDPPGRQREQEQALPALLAALRSRQYAFVTPTPATHQRVIARADKSEARDLRDVFGWSVPFDPRLLGPELGEIVRQGNLTEPAGDGLVRATVRVSSLRGDLYVHSAFPTEQEDAVFFGPDSYRFATLIEAEMSRIAPDNLATIVDVGTGAGVGAIVAKRLCPHGRTVGTDVNPKALRYTAINAAAAGITVETVLSDTTGAIETPLDLALANPPYIVDPKSRTYRDGGDLHGAQVAIDMATDVLDQLSPNGSMILYTGSAIVGGEDRLRAELERLGARHRRRLSYSTMDPDVFGEELEHDGYHDVERIEVVSAIFRPL